MLPTAQYAVAIGYSMTYTPLALGDQMSWLEDGFLSDDVQAWTDSILEEHATEFAFAHELNRAAMSMLRKTGVVGVRQIPSAAFLARGLQSYQAALLLLERGMLADARNVARSVAETAIVIAGLALLHDMPRRLAADNNKHYKTLAILMLENPLFKDVMVPDERSSLRQLLADAETYMQKPDRLNLEGVANEVGLGRFYTLVYRPLSGDAAHPTVDAMQRHIESLEGVGIKLIFKPQADDLVPTLQIAATALLTCFEAAAEAFSNAEMQAFADIWHMRQHDMLLKTTTGQQMSTQGRE
ncbi:DUF5677 domain-containing protein [Massilia sp. IC2-278]|uniref:DUF5677 domain-containing protein n=1 Tax=Massilia sp. IC2-278 TaxID=2887200 RepID=UPI001E41E8EA|nr:DUF5677 domain-containing protein [Massilia sp. IC2-278]MCC2959980.1 DUF5677 domain-containing protein [Massilia sp. IC2-278]